MGTAKYCTLLATIGLLSFGNQVRAQWVTQTNSLKAGWNSVYLHVDASHTDISNLVNGTDPIDEIWVWNADLPPGISVATPQTVQGSQWTKWTNAVNPEPLLLRGNSAMLVKMDDATPAFAWRVQGRPVPPSYRWTLSGLNFVGFPVGSPINDAPTFESFLIPDDQEFDWLQASEIWRYRGGSLSTQPPQNPVGVTPLEFSSLKVARDQAYWIRTGEPDNQFFNQYFGPFQVTGVGPRGIAFGDDLGQARIYVKNMTGEELTVNLRQVPSETAPSGQPQVINSLPLLVRGSIDTSNLTFSYTTLDASGNINNVVLKPKGEPGSEAEIILGLNRGSMTGAAGAFHAGVLELTDSLNLMRVQIGASATVPSRAGLWVGSASVTNVSQYLNTFVMPTNAAQFHSELQSRGLTAGLDPMGETSLPYAINATTRLRYEWDTNTHHVLIFGSNTVTSQVFSGMYLQDGLTRTDSADVVRPFPLRLIVHQDAGDQVRLLQQAFVGWDSNTNFVIATDQTSLDRNRWAEAHRISSVHLPTLGQPWRFSAGGLGGGVALSARVTLGYDDQSSNPFLHTYHPDHDNLDNRDPNFSMPATRGRESYEVRRDVRLEFVPPADDFESLTRGAASLTGKYRETVTFRSKPTTTDYKEFQVIGSFVLTRISDTPTLIASAP